MLLRLAMGQALVRLGTFIQSLPVVVMKPADLVQFSRQSYQRNVDAWVADELVDSSLTSEEAELFSTLPGTEGDLLILGLGGGREAIPLARMGFRVTGVDYVPTMVERAKDNARRRGVHIEGIAQDISHLEVPPAAFDVVFMSRPMYSCVPTRARRVEMVRRIARALRPGGFFLCLFHFDPTVRLSRRGLLSRRLIALGCCGNLAYEEGDILWGNAEFLHAFSSEEAIRSELEAGGLSVLRIRTDNRAWSGALCRRDAQESGLRPAGRGAVRPD